MQTNKSKDMANIKVKLGAGANFFYDMGSGLKVLKGHEVELSIAQQQLPRVRKALQSGLLVKADTKVEDPAQVLLGEYSKMISKKKPASVDQLKAAFNLDQLKVIAAKLDIELEESDNEDSIIEAVNSVLKG